MSGYLTTYGHQFQWCMREEGSQHPNNLKVFRVSSLQSNRYLDQSSLCLSALIYFSKVVTATRHMGFIPRRYIAKRKAGVLAANCANTLI